MGKGRDNYSGMFTLAVERPWVDRVTLQATRGRLLAVQGEAGRLLPDVRR